MQFVTASLQAARKEEAGLTLLEAEKLRKTTILAVSNCLSLAATADYMSFMFVLVLGAATVPG